MSCTECGHALPAGARSCRACGRRVLPPSPRSVLEPPPMPGLPSQRPAPRALDPEPRFRSVPEPRARTAALEKAWPIAIVVLGVLMAIAIQWSAARDDVLAKNEAARRMLLATAAAPAMSPETAPGDSSFSTPEALRRLYGAYDPHIGGAFWTVAGAPDEWMHWNGRRVFINPLISRSDETQTRHVLVTNSLEVIDGLVIKQGTGCRNCKSLIGAALFERRGDEWALVSEQRFVRAEGAWGAPPRVEIEFPRRGGVEVQVEAASAEPGPRKTSYTVVMKSGVAPRVVGNAPGPREKRDAGPRENVVVAGSATVRRLVAAALIGNDEGLQRIARELGSRPAVRGDAEARESRALTLLKTGRVADAESAILSALESGPERPSAWGALGYIYAKQGRRDEALALWRAAHRIAPNPKRILDIYAEQAETDDDPRVRAMLAEAVTRLSGRR